MKNRDSAHPGRIKLTPVDEANGIYDLTRADEPRDEGTPLNKKLLDFAVAACGVTAGTATAYTLDDEFGGFELVDGAKVNFGIHVASGANPTLNVNGTGEKAIVGLPVGLPAGTWVHATYELENDAFVAALFGAKMVVVDNMLDASATYVSIPIPAKCKQLHIVIHGGTASASSYINAAIAGASGANGYTSVTHADGASNMTFAASTVKSKYHELSGERFCYSGSFEKDVVIDINIMFFDGKATASLVAHGGLGDLFLIHSMASLNLPAELTVVNVSGCCKAGTTIFAEATIL